MILCSLLVISCCRIYYIVFYWLDFNRNFTIKTLSIARSF